MPEEIEALPLGSFKGEINVISSTGNAFDKAVAYLKSQNLLGFDTETRPVFEAHHSHNHVALLQLSGPDKAFLFRVFRCGMPKALCDILADPGIIKIGAACRDDVRGLQHYASFEGRSFIDLQKIAWQWGIRDKSVKKLAANILKCKISKTQQLSNWEADVLNSAQMMYAATDAWVCLEMYNKLQSSHKNPIPPENPTPPSNGKDCPQTT